MKPCGHAERVSWCRVCELYETRPDYRALWDGMEFPARSGCIHLGEVKDKECSWCARHWKRGCAVHGETTLAACDSCPDFEDREI